MTCAADRQSGTPGGGAGNPAGSVILALGGTWGDGNDNGEAPDRESKSPTFRSATTSSNASYITDTPHRASKPLR